MWRAAHTSNKAAIVSAYGKTSSGGRSYGGGRGGGRSYGGSRRGGGLPRKPFKQEDTGSSVASRDQFPRENSRTNDYFSTDDSEWEFRGDGRESSSYREERRENSGFRGERWRGSSEVGGRGGGGRGRYGGDRGNPRYSETKTFSRDESKTPTLKDLWAGDVVYGVSPVLAALEAGRRKIHTLYIQEGADDSKRKDKTALSTATAKAKELGAQVVSASKHDLNMVCDNRPHQGLVLDASKLDFEDLAAMPQAGQIYDDEAKTAGVRPPVWLCLDEVVDPQNFGAALRSAYFLGVHGVVTCRKNSAPLSGIVSKASAGSMELMEVHSCRSMPGFLAEARSRDWAVVGAAAEQGAISACEYQVVKPTILVMGNEGYGVRTMVRQQCDAMLQIERGAGGANSGSGMLAGNASRSFAVDSLNVSVATGILLHQLLVAG